MTDAPRWRPVGKRGWRSYFWCVIVGSEVLGVRIVLRGIVIGSCIVDGGCRVVDGTVRAATVTQKTCTYVQQSPQEALLQDEA